MTIKGKKHQEFINNLKKKGRADATVIAYAKDIEQLINYCEEQGLDGVEELTKEDIENFLDELREENYTKKSVSRKLNSIKTFYRFLVNNDYVSGNPADQIPHPKIEPKPPRILSEMEYRALRDVSRDDPRIYAIIELMLQTGIRIGELRRLKLDDIDFKNNEVRIAPYGKHAERKIPFNERAKEALKRYLDVRPESDEDTVFITSTGNPFLVRNIRASINRMYEKAGIEDAMVNDLRHTFIAHQLISGAPLTLISKLAGHKRLSTTERYLKYVETPEEKEEKLTTL